MTALHTLLAPTDLSALARHAALRAAMIATETGARLCLQHVVNINALDSLRHLLDKEADEIERRLLDSVRDEVEALAADIAARTGIPPEVRLSSGPILTEIAAHADAIDASLVVMGARGAGFLREMLIGSTTERVLRKTRHPLLVVKQSPHEPYRRVLVPVDFSERSAEAIRIAQGVAPSAEILLLHAFDVPFEGKLRYAGVEDAQLSSLRVNAKREAVEQLNALIDAGGFPTDRIRRLVLHGDASTCILEEEQQQDCDLIVMGKRGRGALEEMLLGSVSKHILLQSSADVLITDRVSGG